MFASVLRLMGWMAFEEPQICSHLQGMEALKGHVKFLKKVLYLLIRTYASPN